MMAGIHSGWNNEWLASAPQCMAGIHYDIFGPTKHTSIANHLYLTVFVDNHSCYTWTHTHSSMAQMLDLVMKFYADK